VSITTTEDVQGLIVTALLNSTGAGDQVWAPREWPTDLSKIVQPAILVQAPRERKESLGPNAPSYDVLATIRLVGRLTLKAQADDAHAPLVLAALALLQRQIEVAIINNGPLFLVISEIVSVDTVLEIKSDGAQPIGELTMDFVCKFYQGPEAFAQPDVTAITEMALFGDLVNVFDPNGTYPAQPGFDYPVEAAPRESGPDGRVEIGAAIEVEQT
jgi:hypothetical protein